MNSIASDLKSIRLQRDETIEEVAARIGVSHATLSRWESGDRHPTRDNLAAWAAALGWEIAEVLVPDPSLPGLSDIQAGLVSRVTRDASRLPDASIHAIHAVIDAILGQQAER